MDSVPVLVATLVMLQPKKRLNNVVKHLTTVNGQHGHNVRMLQVHLFFATVVSVVDLVPVSVVLSMKSRMLSVTHNAAVTILHGVNGAHVRLHVVPDSNSAKLMTVMANQFNSTAKSVPILSKFLSGLSGALAQLHVVTV